MLILYYLIKIKLIKSYLMITNFLQILMIKKLTQNHKNPYVLNVNNQLNIKFDHIYLKIDFFLY